VEVENIALIDADEDLTIVTGVPEALPDPPRQSIIIDRGQVYVAVA
jgi:hypothetical protein